MTELPPPPSRLHLPVTWVKTVNSHTHLHRRQPRKIRAWFCVHKFIEFLECAAHVVNVPDAQELDVEIGIVGLALKTATGQGTEGTRAASKRHGTQRKTTTTSNTICLRGISIAQEEKRDRRNRDAPLPFGHVGDGISLWATVGDQSCLLFVLRTPVDGHEKLFVVGASLALSVLQKQVIVCANQTRV